MAMLEDNRIRCDICNKMYEPLWPDHPNRQGMDCDGVVYEKYVLSHYGSKYDDERDINWLHGKIPSNVLIGQTICDNCIDHFIETKQLIRHWCMSCEQGRICSCELCNRILKNRDDPDYREMCRVCKCESCKKKYLSYADENLDNHMINSFRRTKEEMFNCQCVGCHNELCRLDPNY